jgi:hypothetical protein
MANDRTTRSDRAADRNGRGTAEPTAPGQIPGRAAARRVQHAEHLALDLPVLGQVQLPRPEQLAYYAGIGLLVALEVLDWPAAVAIAAGHALATQHHNRAIEELGDALEES